MPSIRILPESLRNMIAAGEVVERPASVVKELIENSIDADSQNIEIEISYGGKRLIRVADDGTGMDREDAILSIERYATSKISKIDDLINLRTLGFRGEALSSIASVSRMTVETGRREESTGTYIEIHGGVIKVIKDSPQKGTVITVKDLFYNVPARKKFMKSEQTELSHIIENIIHQALSHYRVRFRVRIDGGEFMLLPQAYHERERIAQIFGADFINGIEEFEKREGEISIKGFISRPDKSRRTRTNQYLFINHRPVKDPIVSKAIYTALERYLEKERHPFYVIFIDMPPENVDFNVHPSKKEVRFRDNNLIYEIVHSTIRENYLFEKISIFSHGTDYRDVETKIMAQGLSLSETSVTFSNVENIPMPSARDLKRHEFIFIANTYIGFSEPDGFMVMDQHAAHERILYERFLKRKIQPTILLFPVEIRLSPQEYRNILDNLEILREYGFEVDDFGDNSVIVRQIPDIFDKDDIPSLLKDIAYAINNTEIDKESDIYDKKRMEVAMAIACHRSVRKGTRLTQDEAHSLLERLYETDDPWHCPHGRPTMVKFDIPYLERLFRRRK